MSSRRHESEDEVALQGKVEKLERMLNVWEQRYSAMEQDRNTINKGYRMVDNENQELKNQKKILDRVNHHLQNLQAEKNVEIMKNREEIGRLNREVERLRGEVERLTTQNKSVKKNSSDSSSWWPSYSKTGNMQTLLEDLNNLHVSSLNMS